MRLFLASVPLFVSLTASAESPPQCPFASGSAALTADGIVHVVHPGANPGDRLLWDTIGPDGSTVGTLLLSTSQPYTLHVAPSGTQLLATGNYSIESFGETAEVQLSPAPEGRTVANASVAFSADGRAWTAYNAGGRLYLSRDGVVGTGNWRAFQAADSGCVSLALSLAGDDSPRVLCDDRLFTLRDGGLDVTAQVTVPGRIVKASAAPGLSPVFFVITDGPSGPVYRIAENTGWVPEFAGHIGRDLDSVGAGFAFFLVADAANWAFKDAHEESVVLAREQNAWIAEIVEAPRYTRLLGFLSSPRQFLLGDQALTLASETASGWDRTTLLDRFDVEYDCYGPTGTRATDEATGCAAGRGTGSLLLLALAWLVRWRRATART